MNQQAAKDLIELVNQLEGLPKTKEVKYGQTTFKYTPLDDILKKIKQNPKWALLQPLTIEDGAPVIKNILIHESGEEIHSGPFTLYIDKATKMQDIGAVITYTRRYSIGAFLGIATEEDADAQFESKPSDVKATEKQMAYLARIYTGENLEKLLKANNVTKLDELSLAKASELIDRNKKRESEQKEKQ